MDFNPNKTPIEIIKEGAFGGTCFRQINRWKKLVKMIRDAGSKFDDYSISPKIRQILLHWGYELTEKDFFIDLTN